MYLIGIQNWCFGEQGINRTSTEIVCMSTDNCFALLSVICDFWRCKIAQRQWEEWTPWTAPETWGQRSEYCSFPLKHRFFFTTAQPTVMYRSCMSELACSWRFLILPRGQRPHLHPPSCCWTRLCLLASAFTQYTCPFWDLLMPFFHTFVLFVGDSTTSDSW